MERVAARSHRGVTLSWVEPSSEIGKVSERQSVPGVCGELVLEVITGGEPGIAPDPLLCEQECADCFEANVEGRRGNQLIRLPASARAATNPALPFGSVLRAKLARAGQVATCAVPIHAPGTAENERTAI